MSRPLTQILCSTVLFLLVGNASCGAFEDQPAPARSEVLSPSHKVTCVSHEAPAGPLDPPATAALPRHEKFVAADHFRENILPGAEARISWLGATFMRRFAVKTEDETNAVTLQTYALVRSSKDRQIIAELDDRYETKLADVWCLLKRQPNGEDGTLQTNAAPNIFFVRDVTGALGAIDAIWAGAGWEIGASEVEGDRQWPSGSRLISR
jgi:hypothetical protein